MRLYVSKSGAGPFICVLWCTGSVVSSAALEYVTFPLQFLLHPRKRISNFFLKSLPRDIFFPYFERERRRRGGEREREREREIQIHFDFVPWCM